MSKPSGIFFKFCSLLRKPQLYIPFYVKTCISGKVQDMKIWFLGKKLALLTVYSSSSCSFVESSAGSSQTYFSLCEVVIVTFCNNFGGFRRASSSLIFSVSWAVWFIRKLDWIHIMYLSFFTNADVVTIKNETYKENLWNQFRSYWLPLVSQIFLDVSSLSFYFLQMLML